MTRDPHDTDARLLSFDRGGSMPVIVCPSCERGSDFQIVAHAPHGKYSSLLEVGIGNCLLCKQPVYMEWEQRREDHITKSWPPLRRRAPSELEEYPAVNRAFDEALVCFQAGSANGAMVMCRRAVAEAAIHFGAKRRDNIPTQLDHLVNERRILPEMREWADQTRIGGKVSAHGTGAKEWDDPEKEWCDEKDANAVIEFCAAFLEYLFVIPIRNRERRKATGVQIAEQSEQGSNEQSPSADA